MIVKKCINLVCLPLFFAAELSAQAAPDAGIGTSGAMHFLAPAASTSADIDTVLADPAEFPAAFPKGGPEQSGPVRSIAGTSLYKVRAMLDLSTTANAARRASVGAGLAREAKSCVATNPNYAATIQQMVAVSGTPNIITAFLAASLDIQGAARGRAIASSGASIASGISGGTIGNGGSGGGLGDVSILTTSVRLSFNGGDQFFRSTTARVSGT
jgi:hypothetical protein